MVLHFGEGLQALTRISRRQWLVMALAFVWYYEGIRRLGTARTVVFNNLVPVSGMSLGWLVLGEPLSASLVLGGVLAITGVFLVNRVRVGGFLTLQAKPSAFEW